MADYTPEQLERESAACRQISTTWADMIDAYATTLRQQAGRVDEDALHEVRSRLLTASVDPSTCTPEFFTGLADQLEAALAQNTQGDGEPYYWLDETTGYGSKRKEFPSQKTALYLHAERARVPDGWVLVPREPTPEMVEAGARAVSDHSWGDSTTKECNEIAWEAMLAAAPSQRAEVDGNA